jgi:alkylation response protein AidB-like acyl-CoA dehydrogenase
VDFQLDEDVALLQRSTRELLEKESALADARAVMEDTPEGFSKALHAQLGELGYLSLLLPPEEGGMGAVALAAVLAEMGRVAFPGPFLDAVLAVRALADCGAPLRDWQQRAAGGEALVVLARSESTSGTQPEAPATRFRKDVVRGAKLFVPFGAHADALLVETRDGLALVPRPGAGWSATPMPTLDHAQRFAEIELNAPATLAAEPERAAEILAGVDRHAALGASALLLGLAERALELAVEYTKEREAFGVPVASFQALQHRSADMLLQVESARSAVFRAAWATDHDPAQAGYLCAVAKAWAGPAARRVCGEALQMHGGVGFTWEYDPHIYLKRTKTLEQFYGSTRSQLELALQARGI